MLMRAATVVQVLQDLFYVSLHVLLAVYENVSANKMLFFLFFLGLLLLSDFKSTKTFSFLNRS